MLSFSYLGYTGIDSLSGLAVTSPSIVLAGSSESSAWLPSGGFKGWYDGWVMTVAENALSIQMNSNLPGFRLPYREADAHRDRRPHPQLSAGETARPVS